MAFRDKQKVIYTSPLKVRRQLCREHVAIHPLCSSLTLLFCAGTFQPKVPRAG
jgi:hypothetical protein